MTMCVTYTDSLVFRKCIGRIGFQEHISLISISTIVMDNSLRYAPFYLLPSCEIQSDSREECSDMFSWSCIAHMV